MYSDSSFLGCMLSSRRHFKSVQDDSVPAKRGAILFLTPIEGEEKKNGAGERCDSVQAKRNRRSSERSSVPRLMITSFIRFAAI